jgi:hypothetical protein
MVFSMEYRRSVEYETLMSALQNDYPNTPVNVLEYAILAHKQFPQAYKNEYKERKQQKEKKKKQANPENFIINGVTVLEKPEVLPSVKIVDK